VGGGEIRLSKTTTSGPDVRNREDSGVQRRKRRKGSKGSDATSQRKFSWDPRRSRSELLMKLGNPSLIRDRINRALDDNGKGGK